MRKIFNHTFKGKTYEAALLRAGIMNYQEIYAFGNFSVIVNNIERLGIEQIIEYTPVDNTKIKGDEEFYINVKLDPAKDKYKVITTNFIRQVGTTKGSKVKCVPENGFICVIKPGQHLHIKFKLVKGVEDTKFYPSPLPGYEIIKPDSEFKFSIIYNGRIPPELQLKNVYSACLKKLEIFKTTVIDQDSNFNENKLQIIIDSQIIKIDRLDQHFLEFIKLWIIDKHHELYISIKKSLEITEIYEINIIGPSKSENKRILNIVYNDIKKYFEKKLTEYSKNV